MKRLLCLLGGLTMILAACSAAETKSDEVASQDNPFQPDYYNSRGIASIATPAGCQLGNIIVPIGVTFNALHGEGRCTCDAGNQLTCEKTKAPASKLKGCIVENKIIIPVGHSVDANDGCNTCTCEKKGKSFSLNCTSDKSCGE